MGEAVKTRVRRGKQLMLFEVTEHDSSLAKACDQFLEARDGLEQAKEAVEAARNLLVVEMEKVRRTSVKHSGRIFTLRQTDPKVSITVKE